MSVSSLLTKSSAISLLLTSLSAQSARPIPYPLPESPAWQRAVAAGTRTEEGLPGAGHWTNQARYHIKAGIEPKTAMVRGSVEITYTNRSPRRLRRLQIHLRQNVHKQGNLRNRYLEITGGMAVENLQVAGEAMNIRSRGFGRRGASVRGTVMTVPLRERLDTGESVKLSMDFSYRVPKRGAPRNGHENNNLFYLGYWYPQVAVYDDVQGWVADQYMSNSEFYMGYGDYLIDFTAPQGWLVRATGTLLNPDEVLTDTAQARLAEAKKSREVIHVISAEDLKAGKITAAAEDGNLTWRFKADKVRDTAVSVSNQYVWDATHAVVKDKHGKGKDGKAMVHAVYRPQMRAFHSAAEYGQHTIEYMSKMVLPYPWAHMTACEGVIGGGMEFPMMTIIGGRGRSVHGVTSHEIIHMWFPMIVGTNEKAYAWMDEGMTSFWTSRCVADFRKRGRAHVNDMRGYLGIAARGERVPLMRHGDLHPGSFDYQINSYTKTAAILHQLRFLVGPEKFDATIRAYTEAWQYKHPYPRDLFRSFNRVCGQDLDWFFRVWAYEIWSLDTAVAEVREAEGAWEVVIEDKGLAMHPTEVEVELDLGEGKTRKETRRIPVSTWLEGKRQVVLKFSLPVRRVRIDPAGKSLDISRRNNSWTGT